CAQYGSRDSRRMPIHPHHGAQRLKPEWVAEARQEFRPAVSMNDGFDNTGAQLRHAVGEPLRHASAMQWEIGDSGTLHTSPLYPYALLWTVKCDTVNRRISAGMGLHY